MAWRKKKTITLVCLRSTWSSSLWQAQREDKFHKHDMKKLWTHHEQRSFDCSFSEQKAASALFGAQKEMNASISTTLLHLSPSPEPHGNPTFLFPQGGSLWGRELLGWRSEGHDPSGRLMLCAADSCPAHLNPLASHQSDGKVSSEHQYPSLNTSSQAQPSGPLPWDPETSTNSSLCQETYAKISPSLTAMQRGESPPLKGGDLWDGPVLVFQKGRALSVERAATSVSPRYLSHRSGRLDRHSYSLSES